MNRSNTMPDLAHLAELLAAERAHATRAWTILDELGLHGLLPDWARQAGAGSHDEATGQRAARQAVNEALGHLLPGFAEALQNAQGGPRTIQLRD